MGMLYFVRVDDIYAYRRIPRQKVEEKDCSFKIEVQKL